MKVFVPMESKNTNKDQEDATLQTKDAIKDIHDRAFQTDDLKFIFDVQQKWFWSLMGLLTRGASFYFAITAALIGVALTNAVPRFLQNYISIIGTSSAALFLIATGALSWLLRACFHSMENSLLKLSPELTKEIHLDEFIGNIKKGLLIVIICSTLSFLIIIVGLVIFLRQLPSTPYY